MRRSGVSRPLSHENSTNTLSRNLASAQRAFQQQDSVASKAAHSIESREPGHLSLQQSQKNSIFLTQAYASLYPSLAVLTIAFLKLDDPVFTLPFVIALSLNSALQIIANDRQERVIYEREKRREIWELENYPEGEIKEMKELYVEKGMTVQDSDVVIRTMAKYKDFFVDIMMMEELNLLQPDLQSSWIRKGMMVMGWNLLWGFLPHFLSVVSCLGLYGYLVYSSNEDYHIRAHNIAGVNVRIRFATEMALSCIIHGFLVVGTTIFTTTVVTYFISK